MLKPFFGHNFFTIILSVRTTKKLYSAVEPYSKRRIPINNYEKYFNV